MEQTKITIDAGNLDDMQKLLGTFDENLNIVTRELGVQASVEGVLLKISGDEDNVTLKKGVKGDSTYILNANKAGKLTITLQQDSPDVAFLEQCAERNVMANLAITDANDSGSMFFAQNVMVSKLPDRARAKEAADVTIIFLIPDIMLSN